MPRRPLSDLVKDQDPVLVSPDTSVREAAFLMRERQVGSVLVMEGVTLAGIFTERDALTRVLAEGLDAEKTAIKEVMTVHPLTLTPEHLFIDALRVMQENGFRHLPVAEHGRPLGIISIRDALGREIGSLQEEAETKEALSEILG